MILKVVEANPYSRAIGVGSIVIIRLRNGLPPGARGLVALLVMTTCWW
jgi:uncharacterized lipoprotein YbaY